jgi:acetyl-CoA synthetase
VADSFASGEIATRLRIAGARAAVTQDVIHRGGKTLPMYDKVVAAGAERIVVVPAAGSPAVALRDSDRAWSDFLSDDTSFAAVPCAPADATNVLFSSGTTGEPKAIPWSHTTPIKCAMDGCYHHDIHPGDVVAWPTNIGWMMGPWLIYASLVNRATIALYYGAPNTRGFCEFVRDAGVQMLGVVPSLVRTWRAKEMTAGLDWSHIRCYSSTGEPSNADDMKWLMDQAGNRPVVEYCGGTEIGGGFITQTLAQPASPGTFSTPALGLDIVILDEEGRETTSGELFVVPPSIGLSLTLLNRDHDEVYYAGTPKGPRGETLRRHGDEMERLEGGYFRIHGRTDDTMNLGGIKVSSAEIERAVAGIEGVVETAAIAVEPPGGGPGRLVIYTVPDPTAHAAADELRGAMQKEISSRLNPLFRVHDVVLVEALPRTASNKVMRRVLRDRYGR